VNVDREWQRLTRSKKPNMRRAFFRGFMAGAGDERAIDWGITGSRAARAVVPNPYSTTGDTRKYWDAGYAAGSREAR
jgi:ribosome modulation factor